MRSEVTRIIVCLDQLCYLFCVKRQGQYDAAVAYLTKAYSIVERPSSCAVIDVIVRSRVLLGVSAAHQMLYRYSEHVTRATGPCIERLLDWKDTRQNEFARSIPDKSLYQFTKMQSLNF